MSESNEREIIEDGLYPGELEIGTNGWLIIQSNYDQYEKEYKPVYLVAEISTGRWNDIRYYFPNKVRRGYVTLFNSSRRSKYSGYLHRVYSSEENAQMALEEMLREIIELKEKNYKGIKYVTVRGKSGFKVCEAEATLVKAFTPDPFNECEYNNIDVWYLKIDGKYRKKCLSGSHCDEDLMRAIFDTREEAEQHCERRNARVAELKEIKERYSF